MYICSKCDYTSEVAVNFCPKCGGAVVLREEAAVVEAPVYEAPVEKPAFEPSIASTTEEAPAPVSKVKSVVGMALSACALYYSAFGVLYAMLYSLMSIVNSDGGVFAMAGGICGFILLVNAAACAIVGLILVNKNIKAGDTSKFGKIGKILAFVAIGLAVLLVFVSLASFIGGIIGMFTYEVPSHSFSYNYEFGF